MLAIASDSGSISYSSLMGLSSVGGGVAVVVVTVGFGAVVVVVVVGFGAVVVLVEPVGVVGVVVSSAIITSLNQNA